MNVKYLVIIIVLVLGLGSFLFKDQILGTTPSTSVEPTPEISVDTSSTTPTAIEGSPSPSATQAEETMVTLTSSGYSPASLTVKAGTKVIFINKSGKTSTVDSDPHPVHTSFPALNLGAFKDGEILTFTFDKIGTYGYHNHLNIIQKGSVVVQ